MKAFLALALALAGEASVEAAPAQRGGMSEADKKFLAYAAKVNK
jgi:hypothetical protein